MLLIWLPKRCREKAIKSIWDSYTDKQILSSHEDATEWIRLSKGMFKSETMEGIAEDCSKRLEKYINPQIVRRGL